MHVLSRGAFLPPCSVLRLLSSPDNFGASSPSIQERNLMSLAKSGDRRSLCLGSTVLIQEGSNQSKLMMPRALGLHRHSPRTEKKQLTSPWGQRGIREAPLPIRTRMGLQVQILDRFPSFTSHPTTADEVIQGLSTGVMGKDESDTFNASRA